MPCCHYIDHEAGIIVTTWEGEATDADFIQALQSYQENVQVIQEYSDYNEIVDFSMMTRIKLTPVGLLDIVRMASATDRAGGDTKLALIVYSNTAYVFANIYRTYRSMTTHSNKIIGIFNHWEEAYQWARSKSNPTNKTESESDITTQIH